MLGGAVGPPIIGSIIGNLVGERVGERAVKDTGKIALPNPFIIFIILS